MSERRKKRKPKQSYEDEVSDLNNSRLSSRMISISSMSDSDDLALSETDEEDTDKSIDRGRRSSKENRSLNHSDTESQSDEDDGEDETDTESEESEEEKGSRYRRGGRTPKTSSHDRRIPGVQQQAQTPQSGSSGGMNGYSSPIKLSPRQMNRHVSNLAEQISSLQEQNRQHTEVLKQHVSFYTAEIKTLQDNLRDYKKKMNQNQFEMTRKEEEVENLNHTIEKQNKRIEDLEHFERESDRRASKRLEGENVKLRKQNRGLEDDIGRKEKELDRVYHDLQSRNDKINQLMEDERVLKEKFERLQTETKHEKAQQQKRKDVADRKEGRQSEMKVKELERELRTVELNREREQRIYEKRIQKAEEVNKKQEETMAVYRNDLKDISTKFRDLKLEFDKARKESESKDDILDQFQSKNENLIKKYQELDQENVMVREDLVNLELSNGTLKQQNEVLRNHGTQLQQTCERDQNTIMRLKTQINQQHQQMMEMKHQISSMQKTIQQERHQHQNSIMQLQVSNARNNMFSANHVSAMSHLTTPPRKFVPPMMGGGLSSQLVYSPPPQPVPVSSYRRYGVSKAPEEEKPMKKNVRKKSRANEPPSSTTDDSDSSKEMKYKSSVRIHPNRFKNTKSSVAGLLVDRNVRRGEGRKDYNEDEDIKIPSYSSVVNRQLNFASDEKRNPNSFNNRKPNRNKVHDYRRGEAPPSSEPGPEISEKTNGGMTGSIASGQAPYETEMTMEKLLKVTEQMENELMKLGMEENGLKGELQKIESGRTTMRSIKRKNEIESRLGEIGGKQSKLKLKLKELGSM